MARIDYAKSVTDILNRKDSNKEKAISLIGLCVDALNEGAEAQRELDYTALADLVAAAEPISDKDWPSANEWDDFTAAVERARKVMKEE
jgi:hypothetical protein